MLLAISLPLLIEQLFIMMVGLADTLMISYAGEEAVSGVSLVNMFITVFLFIFVALASGGAVIVSQYIGSKDASNGQKAAGQLVSISAVISIVFMAVTVIFNKQILGTLFGSVNENIMNASVTYLKITAYSLPSVAIYSAGAAIFRSMGKTKIIMYISVVSNVINVIGNAIGIFVLKASVAGVAWPSLIARTFSAVTVIVLCFNHKHYIYLKLKNIFRLNKTILKKILNIAIPSSFEGGIFQLSKVALGTIVAMFGTTQIAANGIAQSFWSMSALMGVAIGPAFLTVIGQSMGANDTKAAQYYMIKLLKLSYVASILWNGLILLTAPFMLNLYSISAETRNLIIILIAIHNIFNAMIFPMSLPLANGLRAAGDVKFTVSIAIISTIGCRVVFSVIFGLWLNLGVIGLAAAMVMDWGLRSIFYMKRYRSGKWKTFKLI